MQIVVLALEGVFDTGLTAVLDGLATANSLIEETGMAVAAFDVIVAGVRPEVRTALGLQVPVRDVGDIPTPEWVILPALNRTTQEKLIPTLARHDVLDALAALRLWHGNGARIAAACTGTFVLAESGLLDGCEATTTWWLSPLFRQRYPKVRLDANRIVVRSGDALTAGAALSHLDLALWLIRNHSPELASLVAKYLVFDVRLSQSAYAISDHLSHSHPLVERFDGWARMHLGSTISLEDAADALATSARTLTRRLGEVLGKTPIEYIQDLRVERSIHLLKTSKLTLDQIAEQVGYANGATLRALLRRRMGKGVRELRAS
ncbi:GlxA family transcriptional regulator [Burkholderia sp. 3C]